MAMLQTEGASTHATNNSGTVTVTTFASLPAEALTDIMIALGAEDACRLAAINR